MESSRGGLFFSVEELLAVFPRLKRQEALLAEKERFVLIKMEKFLYEFLSVEDIEKIEEGAAVR